MTQPSILAAEYLAQELKRHQFGNATTADVEADALSGEPLDDGDRAAGAPVSGGGGMNITHFVSISGGKDSLAIALLAIERAQRRSMNLRFINADLGANEHPVTHEYIGYLETALGVTIERVRADFTEDMAKKRAILEREWSKEKRTRSHDTACKARRKALSRAEAATLCQCPIRVSPPVAPEIIARAIELLQPTGEPFLDLAMLKGRFPSRKAQFCTERLKLEPINAITHPILEGGGDVISWIGERASESPERARKPPIQRIRWPSPGGGLVLYRPIHKWTAGEAFAIAKRHGIKPNPLYLMGMSRVGCSPCINCTKWEVGQIDRRFPETWDRVAEWERVVSLVSRRQSASFFAPIIGGQPNAIGEVVQWSKTTRGGKQFDMMQELSRIESEQDGAMCESAYGLCE